MKQLLILFLLALTVTHGWTQQAFIDPTSVTLTQQGTVTIIITGTLNGSYQYNHNASANTPDIHVSVGSVTATFAHHIFDSMAELSIGTNITASSVTSGVLDAGTYSVTSDSTVPIQITVILWGESAGGNGSTLLNDLTLAYDSASEQDKAAFQALIISLVQQQLDTLQAQIDSQQNQIDSILSQLAALQDSNTSQHADLQGQLDSLQSTVESQQNSITSLQQLVAAAQEQNAQLSNNLTSLTTQVNSATSNTGDTSKSNDTLETIGVGLGAAGVIGSVVNFFTGDGNSGNSSATDDILYTSERNNP